MSSVGVEVFIRLLSWKQRESKWEENLITLRYTDAENHPDC